jgi:hypothetical protein
LKRLDLLIEKDTGAGGYANAERDSFENRIHLIVNKVAEKLKVSFWIKNLNHELSHIFTYKSAAYRRVSNELDKITAKATMDITKDIDTADANEIIKAYTIDWRTPWYHLRKLLVQFIFGVFNEGLAEYSSLTFRLREKTFNKLYKAAKKHATAFVNGVDKRYDEFLKVDEAPNFFSMEQKIGTFTRVIGMHMWYTIEYHYGNVDPKIFLKKGARYFVKVYEKACIGEGKSPVVSYRSGAGVYDYIAYFKKLVAVGEKKRKLLGI